MRRSGSVPWRPPFWRRRPRRRPRPSTGRRCCGWMRPGRCRSRGSTCRPTTSASPAAVLGDRRQRHHRRVHGADLRRPRRSSRRRRRSRRRCRRCSTPASGWIVDAGGRGHDGARSPTRPATGRSSSTRSATGDRLRGEDCRANLLHVAPSDAMLADALAQYLVWKRWNDWFLIEGSHPEDQALADGLPPRGDEVRRRDRRGAGLRGHRRRAAHRHRPRAGAGADAGLHPARAGARRGGRGRPSRRLRRAPALPHLGSAPGGRLGRAGARELAPGARGLGRDAVADPVRGAGAARPPGTRTTRSGWRCGCSARRRRARRAATSRRSATSSARSEFELAAFKGQKLTFRDWDGQLRQPMLLTADTVVVSVSPQAEFLHQVSQLDTLGIDRPETDLHAIGREAHDSDCGLCSPATALRGRPGARREDLRLEREGQHDHRARRRDARGDPHDRGHAAAARHHRLAGRQAALRLRLGRQPRAGLRHRDLRGAAEPALGAGPGALRAAPVAATRSTSPTRTTTSSPWSTSRPGRCWPRCRSASSPRAWG